MREDLKPYFDATVPFCLTPEKLSDRSRSHFVLTYVPKDIIALILEKNLSIINRSAVIYHDKDLKEDGSPKLPHCHVYIKFKDKKSIKQVREMFACEDEDGNAVSTLSQLVINDTLALQYLVHKNDQNKVQYDTSDVVTYNLEYDDYYSIDVAKCVKTEDNAATIVNEMLAGRSIMDLVHMFGKDFVYHINQYKTVVSMIKEERDLAVKYGHWALTKNLTIDTIDGEVVDMEKIKDKIQIKGSKLC